MADEQTLEEHNNVAQVPAGGAIPIATQKSDDERSTPISGEEVYGSLMWQHAAVRNKFHKGMLMHSLASDYYKVRAYWLHFLPLLAITLSISILSFYVDNETNTTSNGESESDGVTITTGPKSIQYVISIFGVLSTLLTSVGKYFNYQTQTDVHHNAYMALKDVWDRELFQSHTDRKFYESIIKKVVSLTLTGKEDDFERLTKEMDSYSSINVKKLMELYESIEKGCNGSDIPTKIRQAFDMLENDHTRDRVWEANEQKVERGNLRLWRLYYNNRSGFPKTFFPWYIQDFRVIDIYQDDIKDRTDMYALNDKEKKICDLQTDWENIKLDRLKNAQDYKVKYVEMERESERNKAKNIQNHSDALSRKLPEKRHAGQAPQPTDSVPPMGITSEEAAREEDQTNDEEAQANVTNSV